MGFCFCSCNNKWALVCHTTHLPQLFIEVVSYHFSCIPGQVSRISLLGYWSFSGPQPYSFLAHCYAAKVLVLLCSILSLPAGPMDWPFTSKAHTQTPSPWPRLQEYLYTSLPISHEEARLCAGEGRPRGRTPGESALACHCLLRPTSPVWPGGSVFFKMELNISKH